VVPEGDTIHRAAERLDRALAGRTVVRLEAPRARLAAPVPRPGTAISTVEAEGKHLLIRFGDGTTLRTHLRMTGSWHLYPSGARWRMPAHMARVVLEVDGWVAVCFAAPVVEFTRDDRALAHLGPDLARAGLTEDDLAAAAERFALAAPEAEIGTVLLDQRIACGVGNVYKSEVLHVCGVDPFAAVGDIDGATRLRLLRTAARMLAANASAAASVARTTVAGARPGTLAVYGRAGRPCRRCGAPVRRRAQGNPPRATYWCAACQPVAVTAS
jgi:endonuclease-8